MCFSLRSPITPPFFLCVQKYAIWPWFKISSPTWAVYYSRQASYRAIASEQKKRKSGECGRRGEGSEVGRVGVTVPAWNDTANECLPFKDSYTTAQIYTRRNTHSSSSTCHIPLSPDNIAAVKVAASVIGRTNHSMGDGMLPSCRSERVGEGYSRGQAASLLPGKKRRHSSSVASLYASMSFSQAYFCGIWPFGSSISVKMAIQVCSSVLMMLTCRLDSALI